MTGRTHDLAAFTAITYTLVTQPLTHMSLGTALVAFIANMVGGLAPDLDQPTSGLWHKLRGGSILARLISPLIGGHRHISHSIVGVILAGFIMEFALNLASSFLIVDHTVVWWAFMIGYISHIVMDGLTTEGVPLFFPIPISLGFPPLSFFRMRTGGVLEKYLVFPALLVVNAYLIYMNYSHVLDFIKHYIK